MRSQMGKEKNTIFPWQIQCLGFQKTHTNRCARSCCGEIQLYAVCICTHRHMWTFNMLDVLAIFFAYLHVIYFKLGTFFGNRNEIKTVSSEFQFTWSTKQTKAKFTLVRTWNYSYVYSDIKIITSSSAAPKHNRARPLSTRRMLHHLI